MAHAGLAKLHGAHAPDTNILYTQLHRRTHQAIIAAGLDPFLGVLHEGRSRYASLAADLMEPFRFLVDRVVLRMVHHGRLSPDDFARSEKATYPLTVKEGAMRLIFESWESALASEVAWGNRRASFDRHIFHQAESFGLVAEEERAELEVFRMKW